MSKNNLFAIGVVAIGLPWFAALMMRQSQIQPPVQLPPAGAAPSQTASLDRGPWQWQSTRRPDGTSIVAAEPSRYTVTFESDGRLVIRADCNSVLGTYTVDGSRLNVQLGPTTLVGCPPDSQADQFLAGLAQVSSYNVVGSILQLGLAAGAGQMLMSPLPVPALVGPTWTATAYNNGRQAVQSLLQGTEITAVFGTDGQISGSSGCNRYFGPFETSGDSISIGPLGSTRMACDPVGIMEQEFAYLAALQASTQYQFESGRLVLRDATGAMQAIFVLDEG